MANEPTRPDFEQVQREGHKPEKDEARALLRRAVLNSEVRRQLGEFWVDDVCRLLARSQS